MGVSQVGERFEITGVGSPDKLQNDFLSVLHSGGKINHDIQVSEGRLDINGKTVLVFHISENGRTRKPVYLDGDIRRTFLRKGGGDYKAQPQDIERMSGQRIRCGIHFDESHVPGPKHACSADY